MNPIMLVALVVGGLALVGTWTMGVWTPESAHDKQTAAVSRVQSDQSAAPLPQSQSVDQTSEIAVTTAAATTQAESEVETIDIKLGNFYFEGPEGRSGSRGQGGAFDEPTVVLRLKNGVPVRLRFRNVDGAVIHQVISPIFRMPEEEVIVLQPATEIVIDYTPNFLDVADGETVRFNLTCHERHSISTDHYKLNMRAIIEIIP